MCPGIDFLISGSTFDTDIELHKNICSRLHLATYVVIVKNEPFLLKDCTAQRVCKTQAVGIK